MHMWCLLVHKHTSFLFGNCASPLQNRKQDNFGESTGISPKDWSYPKPTKVVFRPPQQSVGGGGTTEGAELYHINLFFQALAFSGVTTLRHESAPGILMIFRCHKHHTYKHDSSSLQHAGDLSHRSLGKPETYGDHINGDLLLRACTSWAMWCCSTTVSVGYRLKSQKSVYHGGVHLMYWE